MDVTGIVAIVAIVATMVLAPAMVFTFVYKIKKTQEDTKKLKYQKEILELEVEKQNNQIRILEEENRKYDRIINAG